MNGFSRGRTGVVADLSIAEIKEAYEGGEITGIWEERLIPERERSFLERCLKGLGELPTGLDVGGGIGLHALLLHERVPFVVHLDYSWTMCSYVGHTRALPTVQGNALRLPFTSGSFDVVMTYGVSTFVRNDDWRIQTVEEMMRVTRLGGFILISTANGRSLRVRRRRTQRLHTVDAEDIRMFVQRGFQHVRTTYGEAAPHFLFRTAWGRPFAQMLDATLGRSALFAAEKAVVLQKLYPSDR